MTAEAGITWSADIARVTAANNRMEAELARLKEKIRDVGKQSKQTSDTWVAGLKNIEAGQDKWAHGMKRLEGTSAPFRRELDTWKLSFAGVKTEQLSLLAATSAYLGPLAVLTAGIGLAKTAAGLLRAEYALFRQELEQSAQGHEDFQKRLVKDVATSRDALKGAEIERFAGSVPGVKPEDVRASLAGVTAEMPTADLSRRKSVAAAVSRLAPTGQDLGQVGRLAGQLGDIMPGVKGEDVADRAAVLVREAGGDLSKVSNDKMQRSIRQLIARGKSPDEAVALALSAAQGKISPETLTAMAQGGQLSREQRMEMKRLTPDVMQANLAMVRATDSEDTIGGVVKGMEASSAGKGERARYAFAQQKASRESELAKNEELFQQYDAFIRAKNAGQGIGQHMAVEGAIGFAQVGRTLSNSGRSAEELAAQNKLLELLIERLRQNAEATEKLAGQRAATNIDRHTE